MENGILGQNMKTRIFWHENSKRKWIFQETRAGPEDKFLSMLAEFEFECDCHLDLVDVARYKRKLMSWEEILSHWAP